MKASIFNITGATPRGTYVFNASTMSLIFVPARIASVLQPARSVALDARYALPLTKLGFIVADREDEWPEAVAKVARRRSHRDPRLIVLPTYTCNLRCSYCYEQESITSEQAWPGGSQAWIEQVVAFAQRRLKGSNGRMTLSFFGGEPLVYSDVCAELAQRIHAIIGSNLYCTLTTNGTILDDGARRLLRYVSSAQVTLDGVGAIHDQFRTDRVAATYKTILEFIRTAADAGVESTIRFHLHSFDAAYLGECGRELLASIGDVPGVRLYFAPVATGCYREIMRCETKHRDPLLSRIEKHQTARQAFLDAGWPESQVFLDMGGNKTYSARKLCGFIGSETFLIDRFGDLYFCPVALRNERLKLGRLGPSGPEWTHLRADLIESPVFHERCQRCAVFPLCQGGCAARETVAAEDGRPGSCWKSEILAGIQGIATNSSDTHASVQIQH